MEANRQRSAPEPTDELPPPGIAGPEATLIRPVRYAIYLIALILAAAALYFARAFFMPVTLAVLLALILSPIVRAGRRRGIPHVASAVTLVSAVAVGLIAGLFLISVPAAQWIDRTPQLGEQLEERLQGIREPVEAVSRASREVEKATAAGGSVGEVTVKGPSLMSRAADNALGFVTTATLALVLTAFILSTSDIFYAKLVQLSPTLSAKKNALGLVYEIEYVISHYMLIVTIINCGLGAAIGGAMWIIGMPAPHLWGAAAALLNFMPYIGPILGMLMVSAVGIVTFDTVAYAMLAPLLYLVLTGIEGGIVTPIVLGRRLAVNPVSIIVAIAFWGWLWGVVGLLVAVPLLVATKVVCDRIPALAQLGEFLSAQREVREAALPTAPQPAIGAPRVAGGARPGSAEPAP